MDKKNIAINPLKMVTIEFKNNEIIIDPVISLGTKKVLIKEYVETLFDTKEEFATRYYVAEYALIAQLLDINTSIEVSDLQIDLVVNHGLWEEVKRNFVNYNSFRDELDSIVKYYREYIALEKSIGNTFDILANKVSSVLEKISEVDLSEEGIAKLLKGLQKEIDTTNMIVNPSVVPERKKKKLVQ